MNNISDEVTNLDMEPKLESLWWTSTYKAKVGATVQIKGRGKCWEMRFVEEFEKKKGYSWDGQSVEKMACGVGGGIQSTERSR